MNCTVVTMPNGLSSSQRKNVKSWRKKKVQQSKHKAASRKDLGENVFAKALNK